MGLREYLLEWIRAFLNNRTQKVRINEQISESINISSGVPQGSVLGPLIFLIYINDLCDVIKHSSIYLFADDIKLFNVSSEKSSIQTDITEIFKWSKKWQLGISYEKSCVLHIGHSNPENSYTFGDKVINDQNAFVQDLGVLVQKT